MERAYPGRAIVQEDLNETKIIIPGKRNWIVIGVVAVWLIGWLLGELFAIGMLTGVITQELQAGLDSFFMLFWFITWTLGGLFIIRAWLYMTFGSEIITFTQGKLNINKKFALFYKPKTYTLLQVRNFSINPNYRRDPLAIRRFQTWNLNAEGAIQFNYGTSTILFANDIDKAEAYRLITLIKEKPIW